MARRLQVLADYRWSSWRVYSGAEAQPGWLRTEMVGSDCGRRGRTGWVKEAEAALGRRWSEMLGAHGDWGRDGLHYVATRDGGYRLAQLVGKVEGLKYQAAAQGVRRFRQGLASDPAKPRFVTRLRRRLAGP